MNTTITVIDRVMLQKIERELYAKKFGTITIGRLSVTASEARSNPTSGIVGYHTRITYKFDGKVISRKNLLCMVSA